MKLGSDHRKSKLYWFDIDFRVRLSDLGFVTLFLLVFEVILTTSCGFWMVKP